MIPRHVIYCDHYPDGAVEAGSNARERKPATVSHEGRRTKFGSLGYFDVPSSKMALIFKFRASMTSL